MEIIKIVEKSWFKQGDEIWPILTDFDRIWLILTNFDVIEVYLSSS